MSDLLVFFRFKHLVCQIKGKSCLALGAMISASSFDLLCSMVRFLQPSMIVLKDSKHELHRVMP